MSINVNINQFAQTPVRGELDLQIAKSGVITGVISANQATSLKAGDSVKLDTASGQVPSWVSAAIGDAGGSAGVLIGKIIFDPKKSTYVAGDPVQVALACPNNGTAVYMQAGATVSAGAPVEEKSDGTVQAKSAQAMRGYALDPGVANDIIRVILSAV